MKNLFISLIALVFTLSVSGQNVKLDKQLGKENAKMVEAQMGIYDDQEKSDYVRKVGNRVLAQLEKPLFEYQIQLVPDMIPNAFALSGGYLYVTTGLLPILQSEDELACILGHEIVHSNNRHSVKQLKKSVLPRLLELPGDLIGVLDKDLGALFNAPIQTSNALLLSAYSRDFESEADDIGIKLAAKAGYDPSAMITSLYRMSYAMEVATGQTERKSYFNSHPYTPNRARAVEKIIAKLDWEKQDPISDNFLMEFDSVLFGANPDIGVIRDNQFLHPILDFTVFFPENWNIDNQPTNVGGYHPDRQAAAFVSLDDPGLSPEQAGKRFINEMDREYKSKMKEATPYNFRGKEGYLIAFIDKSSKITMYAYVLWIPMDGKLFKILGIAPLKYEPQLDMIAESLRPLNESEKSSFTIDLLRVVKANKGETIADLSKRVGNVLNNELTAIINDKYEDDELDKDELIKVALTYPYYPVKQ